METWKLLALAAVVLVFYGVGVAVLGAPASPAGLVVVAVSLTAGLLLGRAVSRRYLED